jgi:hypothetical protein
MRRLLLIALLTAVTPWMSAQRMSVASPRFARSYHARGYTRTFADPLALYDYSDFFPGTEDSSSVQPVIVVQSPPPSVPVPERTSAPAQPLLIELQGDRYVRVTSLEAKQTEIIDRTEPSPEPNSLRTVAAPPPAAVLLFRDGHREEISNYMIAGGVLYIAADYYATGSWNRRIEISSLNLSGTVQSNHSRGTKFRLPQSPNEVIIGP